MIGALVRKKRKEKGLTQAQLASGICAQSMISSIEKGEYLPNAAIFLQLCARLEISIDEEFLHENLRESPKKFSQIAFEMCKQHDYAGMLKYLDRKEVINSLNQDADFQVYYYYYACGIFRVSQDLNQTTRYVKMALAYTMPAKIKHPKTEVEILLVNALALLQHLQNNHEKAQDLFEIVNQALERMENPRENLNVVDYQYGNFLYNQGKTREAIAVLQQGFLKLKQNQSYFMLAEYALLLMKCYEKIGDENQSQKYQQILEVFEEN